MLRYQELDIHSAVSLMGCGESRITEQAAAVEELVLTDHTELIEVLNHQKVKRAYRAARAIAHNLEFEFLQPSVMRIKVRLERGVFLTSLLGHIFKVQPPVKTG